jgi:hypothetical protein
MNNEITTDTREKPNKKLTGIILGYEDGSMEYIEDGRVVVTQLFTNEDDLTMDRHILNGDRSTDVLFNYGMRYALKEDGWLK